MSELGQEVRDGQTLPPPPLRKAIREAVRISRTRMADELQVSVMSIYRWETGQREPRGAKRAAYARLLREMEEATR